ncbi:MFS transporter ['Paenibacillus yunnanensis' Narsing Rao et al. 2020]|uniref:MFS transporter n=1 Tax=Paenibacillus tengchongensis TaxID=2608684 RepID=UPI00124D4B4E|nr:MFS transporter [Paenibacillus tengchongensis]
MNKPKLWTRDFIVVIVTTFFTFLSFYLLMTSMTVYTIEQFKASQGQAGLASTTFILGGLISRVLAGRYMDRIGRKKLMYSTLALYLLATLLYYSVNGLAFLYMIRFVHGIAFGAATTALTTAAMDLIPRERRGEGTSYFSLSTTLATAVGPFLGLFITQHYDYDVIFTACSVFSVLSILVALLGRIPEAEEVRPVNRGFKWNDFFEVKAVPVSSIIFLLGIAYSGILSYLNSFAIHIGLTEAASFFFVVYAVVVLLSRPFTGRLLDTRGDNVIMYPALVLFSIGLVLLGESRHGLMLLLAGVIIGLGYGTVMSSAQAITAKVSPPHRIGLATSTFFFSVDLGIGVGPLIVGILVPYTGYRGMYLTMAALVLGTVAIYHKVHGRREKQSPMGKGRYDWI